MRQLTGTELKRLHRQTRKASYAPLALILEGIASPFNLGSILRTAAAYRVEQCWIAQSQINQDSTHVGKTSLGTERYVNCESVDTFSQAADLARTQGFRLIGLELADEAQPIPEIDFTKPTCLVVGHEDRGLSKTALAQCDEVGYLPQLGRIGSLNVATATSIAIWEARRKGF